MLWNFTVTVMYIFVQFVLCLNFSLFIGHFFGYKSLYGSVMSRNCQVGCFDKDSHKQRLPSFNFQVGDLGTEGQEVAGVQYLHDCWCEV